MSKRKLVVIGLDGATWSLLNILMERGDVPNIKRLVEMGASGTLRTVFPPVTAPAWASLATGNEPRRHHLLDFVKNTKTFGEYQMADSRDIKDVTFYEVLEQEGKKCIIINMPGSYPPKTNGIFITSLMTKGEEMVFPASLREEFPILAKYRLTYSPEAVNDSKKFYEEIREIEKTRFEAAKEIFVKKDWDLFFMLISGTDWVQHRDLHNFLEGKFPHTSLEFYKDVDEEIGYFLDNLPKNANLIVLSDHGFRVYPKTFRVNEFLKEEGALKTTSGTARKYTWEAAGKNIGEVDKKKVGLRVPGFMLRFLGLVKRVPPLYTFLRKNFAVSGVRADTANSSAFCPTTESFAIYLNSKENFENGILEKNEASELRKRLLSKMKELGIFEFAEDGDEYFGGFKGAPDLVFYSPTHSIDVTKIFPPVIEESGLNYHDMDGVFMACGPDIEKCRENCRLIDIMPTILFMLGSPVPTGLDGKAISEIIRPDSELYGKTPEFTEQFHNRKTLKDKLASLKKKGL